MEQTTNYGLKKFGYDDGADIALINENMDVIDADLAKKGNKNLLHNWDFRNPVNKKNQKEYTEPNVYTIDRWISLCKSNEVRIISLSEAGVELFVQTGNWARLRQRLAIRLVKQLAGCIVTFSVQTQTDKPFYLQFFKNNNDIFFEELFDTPVSGSVYSITALFPSDFDAYSAVQIMTSAEGGSFSRAKLELGSVSTLANDPPADYAAQAMLCQHMSDDGIYSGRTPNKNLLHNWDFRNPVNQRGQSVYQYPDYAIDRWIFNTQNQGTSSIELVLEGINIKKTDAGHTVLAQRIEKEVWDAVIGKPITASFWLNDKIISHSFTVAPTGYQTSPRIDVDYAIGCETFSTYGYIQFVSYRIGHEDVLRAAKLEVGTVSTLANDPPADYGEQLALCQRYYRVCNIPQVGIMYMGVYKNTVYFDPPMRVTPFIAAVQGNSESGGLHTISLSEHGWHWGINPDSPNSERVYLAQYTADANL